MSGSLVRVSRRVEWGAHGPLPRARKSPKARLIGACCVGRPPRRCLLERRSPGLLPSGRPATISASSRAANKPQPFRFRPRRTAGPHPLPSRQFQALFDSLFKVLFIFPSRYLFAIGLSPIFSLGRNLSPIRAAFPNNPTRDNACECCETGCSGRTVALPSPAPLSRVLGPGPCVWTLLQTTNSSANMAARFQYWAYPGSLAVTRGIS
ncbi:hypothetical protein KFK09_029388 [Dendrobium nobile]|uniref:Uncharacterized protein n=1 Tax=Dendrobium nobile TaxID=94219 RepID=A0A8T3A036_DENNO|nr:hypothetical protein KFK09_029388 [Dendrobium nobile]